MAISEDWAWGDGPTAAITSESVDITAAAVGSTVYLFCGLGANQTSVTATGWSSVGEADESTTSHWAILKRVKQSGDTTFTVSWPTSTRGSFCWVSFLGVGGEEGLTALNKSSSSTSCVTGSATPGGSDRWALGFFYQKSTTSTNKAISWTSSVLTEEVDQNNSGASSNPWVGVTMADSAGPVSVASHSYTAVSNHAESHGAGILLYIYPPSANVNTSAFMTFF